MTLDMERPDADDAGPRKAVLTDGSEHTAPTPHKATVRRRAEAIVAAWEDLTAWEAGFFADHAALETWGSTGGPLPPFSTFQAEAADWVAWASEVERCHYLLAIWRSLPESRRRRFLSWAWRG